MLEFTNKGYLMKKYIDAILVMSVIVLLVMLIQTPTKTPSTTKTQHIFSH